MVRLSKIMPMLLDKSKKKPDIQKFKDCIRSNSEKRGSENKQKMCFFCWYQQIKIHCVQVFKPTFHETVIIFL